MASHATSGSVESLDGAHTPIGSPQSLNPSSPPFEESQEQPRKLKGRQRLLAGLNRISSSPSIARLNTSRSGGYTSNGKGSISCISLNSAATYGSPAYGFALSQEVSASHASPSISAATTPAVQTQNLDEAARIRQLPQSDTKVSAGLPADLRSTAKVTSTPGIVKLDEDYFSRPVARPNVPRRDIDFWRDMPSELRMEILTYLEPKEIVRCSSVSKSWHHMCFDGQLWAILDTAGFYQDIPGDALVGIITAAGPFVRDLNLRGCVQLRERWNYKGLSDACTNLESLSLEGCRIDRASIHNFLWSNNRLVHINLSGLAGATNAGMKIISQNCSRLEHLNISWCNNVDTRGLRKVVDGCRLLKDLRAGEIRGWDDVEFMQLLFERNSLERLILMNCDTLTDESMAVLIEGKASEIDYISGRPIVPPRRLKHLDLTRCRSITDKGVRTLVNNIPDIEGLQLSKCRGILDATLAELLPTTPKLTHLDLEELDDLSNATLQVLAGSSCARRLRHLSISYCENMGDAGMLPVIKACTNLRSVEMDNTRIGDLVLAEAAGMVRKRSGRTTLHGVAMAGHNLFTPKIGLRLVAYDCQNVTWTGVREVLSRNADVSITTHTKQLSTPETGSSVSLGCSLHSTAKQPQVHTVRTSTFPVEVIQLKCFYTYQPTVEEHFKRIMRGDFIAARRLERKWAEFMIAQEEASTVGGGRRRRERRARQAAAMHADEHADEEDVHAPGFGVGGGRRRRARSGGCTMM
ncbi:Putative F-box domain, leucine-rich repeat domain superfamily, F-box-like domain superfamily [Septoria linicola]|uniref:F-box domain, leucine-rich repeat domain superfamily, F-box-like domain superfamily n=1 Tax=Septoria linicola TaxID=215465 RepID=A0A9Q9AKD9_9PEZI|nr:putative F-box domain, leucine-rich repeat domain superfamily, F-box-like domain superfamily [Septoria linicola]USW47758.1 Putative F-box domain, leucine-rich repeat domain superfamily, F-box-like domain superfamily [Septoria linicola]